MTTRGWWLCALLLGSAGCADEDAGLRRTAQQPEASLRAPVIAPVGAAVRFDASASSGRPGEALTYVFDFADGAEPVRSTEPTAQHVFTHEGLYSVRVRVLDGAGNESLAVQDVAVRADYPVRPDFCRRAGDCIVGDECDAGVCYTTGGRLQ